MTIVSTSAVILP